MDAIEKKAEDSRLEARKPIKLLDGCDCGCNDDYTEHTMRLCERGMRGN